MNVTFLLVLRELVCYFVILFNCYFLSLQLEVWRGEAKREKEARSTLQAELRDRDGRLGSLEDELKRLSLANEDLLRQLDVAMAFSRSGAVAPKPGTPAATLESATSQL